MDHENMLDIKVTYCNNNGRMKRYFLLIMLLFMPLSLWAMTPISDDELSDISGQTGVSIFVDITMNIHIDCIAWGDSDGLGSYWDGYRSGGTSSQGKFTPAAEVSIASNPISLELWDILQKYRSSSGVCFFPEPVSMDFVDGSMHIR